MELKKSKNITYNQELITLLIAKNKPIFETTEWNMFEENVVRFRRKLVELLLVADQKDILIDLYEWNMKVGEEIVNFAEFIEDFTIYHRFVNPDLHNNALVSIYEQLGKKLVGKTKE